MLELLWLIPCLPFAGFIVLAVAGKRIEPRAVAFVGVGSVAASAVISVIVAVDFMTAPPPGYAYTQTIWQWLDVAGFSPGVTFYLDALSTVMMLVVTIVGFLIHLYSSEFMEEDEGYSRFFAYMNLFVGSMLVLLLARNLLLFYLGWEGVGLCSYLLIGFWYKDPNNGYAARKAFVVTRVGDAAMAVGLFLLYNGLGTLQIQELMQRAHQSWSSGSLLPVAAAALLLGGAVGKSAQLPLQTWLPDAMAGPTPVSALIHAATMVTAGVYIIARTHVLFELAPPVLAAVAVIGALTLLLSGFSAITQKDIKRVLAYSTISQIGYMFLALGVGAWSAAIFHFMTHAFFKALLFLGAGVIIHGLHHEHDMFKMGGLRKQLPVTFWTFLIGSASLSAIPLVTAGFFSKDQIIWLAWSSGRGGTWLWAAGVAGALLTSIYTFRMVFITFFGEAHAQVSKRPGLRMIIPLVVLAFLSVTGGYIQLPAIMGNITVFSGFLHTALPPVRPLSGERMEWILEIIAVVISLGGVLVAWLFFLRTRGLATRLAETSPGMLLHRFWFSGWAFDWVYDLLFVRPFVWLARINRDDFMDLAYAGLAWYNRSLNRILSLTQNGRVRFYAMGIALGAIITVAIAVLR
ncbi:MAG: NADH-quinone oxidoreductase subunit L [Candidatus Sulfobium sp.]|jgi:NADH-quinone oxidoreductase subunit L